MAGWPLLGWGLWNGKGGLQGRGEGDRANGEGLGHGEGTGPLCPVDNSPSTQQEACGAVLSEARASSPGPQAAPIPPHRSEQAAQGVLSALVIAPGTSCPGRCGDTEQGIVPATPVPARPGQCREKQPRPSSSRGSRAPPAPALPAETPPAPRSSWDPQYLWQGAGRASPLSAVPRGRPGRVAGGRWTWLGAALQGKVP